MKRTLHCLAIVASLIGVVACREDISPLVSAEVSFRSHDGTNHENALTQEQLQLLSNWLEAHRSGWRMHVVTDPMPSSFCRVKHADGQTSTLSFYSVQSWTRTVKLCDLGRTNCVMQLFPEQEMLALLRLLAMEQ
jgi:hypothetical protein